MSKIIVICGPTAVGKTDLAFAVAKELNGELVSADSRQIYSGMDIGTGKDIPLGEHIWLTDIIEPTEQFGSGLFHTQAIEVIEKVQREKKVPIIVGGTGFYIKSLINPSISQHIPPNPELRQKLAKKTIKELQQLIQKINPTRWQSMNHSDQCNPHRLIRALEVAQSNQGSTLQSTPYEAFTLGLNAPVEDLIDRIRLRVQKRLDQGFESEVKRLMKKYPNFAQTPGGLTMGYAEWIKYLRGELLKDEAIALWTKREIDYMKRQRTWFKQQPDIVWFDITDKNWYAEAVNQLKQWMM